MAFLPAGNNSCEEVGPAEERRLLQPSAFTRREAAPPQGSAEGSPSSEGVPGHAGATTAPTEPVSTGAKAGTERLMPQTPSFHVFGVTANISPYPQYCGPPRDPSGACVPPGPCRTTEGGKDSSGLRPISPSFTLQMYLLLSHKTLSPSILADKDHPLLGIPSATLLLG